MEKMKNLANFDNICLNQEIMKIKTNLVFICLIHKIIYFQYFQKEMPGKFEADPEPIFSMAFNLKINQKKMKR